MKNYKYVIVGSGFAGSIMAERIANIRNEKVLLIEKRNHIGGNCYDYYDENSVLIHKYGPHIFHTNYEEVWDYLEKYSEWREFQLELKCNVDGKNISLPFNLNTLQSLFPEELSSKYINKLLEYFEYGVTVPILDLMKHEDPLIKKIADYIYKKVYLNYMIKQWGARPEELDSSVTERVPIKIGMDDRYFYDKYQALPRGGYTRIFEKILDNKNINLMLNTDIMEHLNFDENFDEIYLFGEKFEGTFIYTGMIDELFNYKFGELPYRSLKFEFEFYEKNSFQKFPVVSYPNNNVFTRITEYKYLTGQNIPFTTIGKEFPQKYNKNIESQNVPYYPIPKEKNRKIYRLYENESQKYKNLILVGRLAEYMYYNMDNIIKRTLDLFDEKIRGLK